MKGSYGRFAAMVGTSTILMFALMYLNTFRVAHIHWSETRAYMALIMGAVMAVVMLAFMSHMYGRKRINAAIVLGAGVVFVVALALVRTQATVGDVAWMRAMIPHHSIAVLTSTRAELTDPRVRRLAERIIASQTREIGEMEALISDLQQR